MVPRDQQAASVASGQWPVTISVAVAVAATASSWAPASNDKYNSSQASLHPNTRAGAVVAADTKLSASVLRGGTENLSTFPQHQCLQGDGGRGTLLACVCAGLCCDVHRPTAAATTTTTTRHASDVDGDAVMTTGDSDGRQWADGTADSSRRSSKRERCGADDRGSRGGRGGRVTTGTMASGRIEFRLSADVDLDLNGGPGEEQDGGEGHGEGHDTEAASGHRVAAAAIAAQRPLQRRCRKHGTSWSPTHAGADSDQSGSSGGGDSDSDDALIGPSPPRGFCFGGSPTAADVPATATSPSSPAAAATTPPTLRDLFGRREDGTSAMEDVASARPSAAAADSGIDGHASPMSIDSDSESWPSPPSERKRNYHGPPPTVQAPFHPPPALMLVHKKHVSSPHRHRNSVDRHFETLPVFADVETRHHEALCLRKLHQCYQTFDFCDVAPDMEQREQKTETLMDLAQYFRDFGPTDSSYGPLCRLMETNAFRVLAPPPAFPNGVVFDPEEDDPRLEESWPHLQLVYEIFVNVVDHRFFNRSMAQKHMDARFVQQLLNLMDSEDPRERDFVKTIIHRIYGKCVALRSIVRRFIYHALDTFIHAPRATFNGVSELLEFYGSIINGFMVPLKEEHKELLSRILVPLHKHKSLSVYFPQLSYCILQFLEKDPRLVATVIPGLVRVWPKVHALKEVLFLTELDDILDVIVPETFQTVKVPIMRQVVRSCQSQHFQVADRALSFWNNNQFLELVAEHCDELIPMAYPVLVKHAKRHWHRNIHMMSQAMVQRLRQHERFASIMSECSKRFPVQQAESAEKRKERRQRWAVVEAAALKNPLCSSVNLCLHAADELTSVGNKRSRAVDEDEDTDSASSTRVPRGNKEAIMLKNSKLRRNSIVVRDENVEVLCAVSIGVGWCRLVPWCSCGRTPLSQGGGGG
eukprot:m.373356 g.373356  ORF g.373356 m.373356 type:complete len:927 (-) comp19997_c5_seq2:146-2926(-)